MDRDAESAIHGRAERAGSAKSVFHFDVQGSVAEVDSRRDSLAALHSLHSSAAWQRVRFWLFDGWEIPSCAGYH
jgi:hypothetical protein